jgi:pantothenate kinase
MQQKYDDLAYLALSQQAEGKQLWIGIAGGPGSGKSTTAAAVSAKINAITGNDKYSVVLPMDGFHYSRAKLKELSEAPGAKYTYDELIARRGSPWTFDPEGLIAALSAAKAAGSGSLPIYSRQKSDPVPDGVQLLASHRIVLVEGNYLLTWDDPAWAPLKDLFDVRWYMACKDMDVIRKRLVKRHLGKYRKPSAT